MKKCCQVKPATLTSYPSSYNSCTGSTAPHSWSGLWSNCSK